MFPDVLMGCIKINMFIWVQSNKAVIGGSRNFWQFISGGGPYGCAFTAVDLTTVIFSACRISEESQNNCTSQENHMNNESLEENVT